jgi:S-DNA-T family DNA segregation ATPase FtsK/SpoIIIE
MIYFDDIVKNNDFVTSARYNALLGVDENNDTVLLNMHDAVHVLIAGATGSGKSCLMKTIISSLMLHDVSALFVLIDPKRVEFFDYSKSSRLYNNRVIENTSDAICTLNALVEEMNVRYMTLKALHMRSSEECSSMPDIYICVDELSFLILEDKKKAEEYISKIGMLGRAAGIHLILATQHPDRKTITGVIQANLNTVIGLSVREKVDSRMIIGNNKCASLKGNGDAILVNGLQEIHFQSAYIEPDEIREIADGDSNNTFIINTNNLGERKTN